MIIKFFKIRFVILGMFFLALCALESYGEVYYNEQFLLVEEEKGQNRFYALVDEKEYYKYVQYSGDYNQVFVINNLFDYDEIVAGMSAIDDFNRRYFFATKSGNSMVLNILGLDTGEMMNQISLQTPLLTFDYDKASGFIYGLSRHKFGMMQTLRIDPYTGNQGVLANINRVYSMLPDSSFIYPEKNELWIAGRSRGVRQVFALSLESGLARGLRTKFVDVNETLVYNFNLKKKDQHIFSQGTKNSIFLLGYNESHRIIFISHFTIESTNVKDQVRLLQEELMKHSPNGIKDYDITIISGKPYENFLSFTRALSLENKLKQDYGIEEVTKEEFFIGKPYSVLASSEGFITY